MKSNPRSPGGRPGHRARLVAAAALLAFAASSWPADARRTSIRRGVPLGGDWRPVFPLLEEEPDPNRPRTFLFTAGADGTATISFSADAQQAGELGFRLDNLLVFEAAQLALAFECARDPADDLYLAGQEECWIRTQEFGCYNNRIVQVPIFDADAPPANLEVLETFEAEDWQEVPADWTLVGACWDDGATPDCAPSCPPRGAPRFVRSDPDGFAPEVCNFRVGSGGFLAFADPDVPGCQPPPGEDPRASVRLTGLEPGAEYAVQVWWGSVVDMEADGSEILYTSGPPDLLLVDDDDGAPDVRASYAGALDALSIPYQVWDTGNSDGEEPAASDLEDLEQVIWFSGDAVTDPPPGVAGPGAAGEAALGSFLDAGGCLLISSQDYLADRGGTPTPFMADRLGVAGGTENGQQDWVTGAGPFAGLGPWQLTYPFANASDVLVPAAGAATAFDGDQGVAATARDGAATRAAFWAFPLEALPAANRRQALTRFFDWCRDPTLRVRRNGTGTGRVTSSSPRIDCGADCSASYRTSTQVTLSAAPAAGSAFSGWSGGGCSGTGPCVVRVDEDQTVTATFDQAGGGCTPDATTLCLPGDGRFRVSVAFETVQGGGRMGDARAIPLDPLGLNLGGIFAFVNEANPEFLVKVLDGCGVNGHYWVFYAATTNLGFRLTVVDTQTPGAVKVYTNPDVHPADTLTDTMAFATCP